MALPPKTEESFLREVDEELRLEQLSHFWRRYGRILMGAVLVGLALFGAWLWWQADQEKTTADTAERYTLALEDFEAGRWSKAKPTLEALSGQDSGHYSALSRMLKAARMIEAGNSTGAVKAYQDIAADQEIAQPIRDAALIRSVALQFDTTTPEMVIERLKPLAIPGNAWFGSAGEMTAAAWIKLGRSDKAAAMLQAVGKDKTVPQSIRARVDRMGLALDVGTTPKSTPLGKE